MIFMTEKQKQYVENAASMAGLSQVENWIMPNDIYIASQMNQPHHREVDLDKLKSFDDYIRILKATNTKITVWANPEQIKEIEDFLLPK
jgi:hypothetical protein